MKSVNYALLLMVSPFIIAGCGGSSTPQQNEPSAADMAVEIEHELTSAEEEVETTIADIIKENGVESADKYRKAEWIPTPLLATSNKQLADYAKASTTDVVSNKVISDGDDASKWYIYSGSTTGATISSTYDAQRAGNVVSLSGAGKTNGYALGWTANDWTDHSTNKLNDTVNKTIKWSMKYSEDYMIYVIVRTNNGYRYLYYTDANQDYGVYTDAKGYRYLHHGLGLASNDGTWSTFTRNLSADLHDHEPLNEIISVDGFLVRGSGYIDDVELLPASGTEANTVVYEDAEDGQSSRWAVYDNDPAVDAPTNVYDNAKASKVISLCGTGLENGFILGAWDVQNGWKNTMNKEISWDMNFNNNFVVYLSVITSEGHRFITYSPMNDTTFANNPTYGQGKVVNGDYTYIHLGLNPNTRGGSWQTVSRNLETDLKKYEPNNSLVSVTAFLVRGCGKLDNIKMFDTNTNDGGDNSTN